MKKIQLSKRLSAVADLVPEGCRAADIGTDHGFVPIYLINTGKASHVIAMDVNEGPLQRATEHIREYGLEDSIEVRLSDGMKELSAGEADTIICAGMGGLLMKRILTEGSVREKGIRHMVLQPQSDIRLFREYLREERYVITDEAELFEEGKYYVAMAADCEGDAKAGVYADAVGKLILEGECDEETALRICDRFGPALILKKNPCLKKYLEHEKDVLSGILLKLSENEHTDRIHDIINKINDITTVLKLF